jgi:hypothetical protein
MVAATNQLPSEKDLEIFGRLFFGESRPMTSDLARYFLSIELSKEDLARISDLLKRNQSNLLSPAEESELRSYSHAGTMLAIFQSKARRILNVPPPKPRRKK